jgi:hypothetical protein
MRGGFVLDRTTEMATDEAVIGGVLASPDRVKRKRRRLPPKINKRSRIGRRVVELKALFTSSLVASGREMTDLLMFKLDAAAEAQAVSEAARQAFLRGQSNVRAEGLATLERLARDAVKALGIDETRARVPTIAEYLAARKAERD